MRFSIGDAGGGNRGPAMNPGRGSRRHPEALMMPPRKICLHHTCKCMSGRLLAVSSTAGQKIPRCRRCVAHRSSCRKFASRDCATAAGRNVPPTRGLVARAALWSEARRATCSRRGSDRSCQRAQSTACEQATESTGGTENSDQQATESTGNTEAADAKLSGDHQRLVLLGSPGECAAPRGGAPDVPLCALCSLWLVHGRSSVAQAVPCAVCPQPPNSPKWRRSRISWSLPWKGLPTRFSSLFAPSTARGFGIGTVAHANKWNNGSTVDAPSSVTLAVRTSAGRVASFHAHAFCFSEALHPYSRAAARGIVDEASGP
jgi:hypothetical protein